MQDLGTMEDLQRDWNTFEAAVKKIKPGNVETFREVNQTLGWNLAKSVPILLKHKVELDKKIHKLNDRINALEQQITSADAAVIKAKSEMQLYKDITKGLQQNLKEARKINQEQEPDKPEGTGQC
jgi:peptidoglycan hydrolase CwlO-like protein